LARTLARLARIDPELLGPVRHRSARAQIHLTVIRARAALVSTRTALVNAARGLTKCYGERLRKCGTGTNESRDRQGTEPGVAGRLGAAVAGIESLNERIAEYDRRIEQIAKEAHPEVALLQQGSRSTDCNAQLAPSENRSTKRAHARMATEATWLNGK